MDVDWDDLQAAFLSTRTDKEYYLDRESGEVVSISESEDKEDEEGDAEEGEDHSDEETLREVMDSEPDRFVLIDQVDISDLVEWMSSFILTVTHKDLTQQLVQSANGHHPDRDFDRILRKHPGERVRWIGFLETQVQEIIDGWIEENDIESDSQPPWKLKAPRRRPSKKSREPEPEPE